MKTILLILIIIVFAACGRNSKNEQTETVKVIDLLSEPESKVTKLSEIAANIEYIPLQTTKSSLIGPIILKIININNRIFILNSGFQGEILCFDLNGKFLFKLQKKGRGPEEYIYITDFDVSSDNKFLTILSSLNRKLLIYEISETGFTFQRSITLKEPAPWMVSLVPETDNVFLAIPPWRGTEPTLSLLINTVGDIIHFKPNCYKYENVRKSNYMAINEMLVYTTGNTVCFKEEFSDTVFYIDVKDNSFKPRIILNSHGTVGTPEIRGGSESAGNLLTSVANIFETSRYIFYYYISSGPTRNRILYDKKTDTKYKLDVESELKDDLSGGPDFNIEFLHNFCSGDRLFSFVEAIALKKYVAGEDFKNAQVSDPKKKNELKKLADSLDETDNPVLIIVTPKK